jgi:hypothetical protein
MQATLDIDSLITDLTETPLLPRRALSQAIAHNGVVTPAFLTILEDYVAHPLENARQEDAIFFAIHLLAQFREKRAYRPLMRLLALDAERVEAVLGDAVTTTLPRVVASLFDGDLRPAQAIIENAQVDEFVRSSVLEALGFLTAQGEIDLGVFKKYLLWAYGELQPQADSMIWVAWQGAISLLELTEFRSLVRKAFATGKIHPSIMSYEHFEEDLRETLRCADRATLFSDRNLGYFEDTIGEFSEWYGFSYARLRDLERRAARSTSFTGRPANLGVNPLRGVGRNDPCPCGSGRKFKKCCLQ